MRKRISENIKLENITAELKGNLLKLTKDGNSVDKKMNYPLKISEGSIIIECEKPTKNHKKLIKTSAAHVRNMICGLNEKYVYKMQICTVHFPMSVSIKGQAFIVKNFLGEIKERVTKILPGVEVKIDKEIITVEGHDKEKVGQTAANIENITRIRNRDRRIFQDGIFITEKQKGVKK